MSKDLKELRDVTKNLDKRVSKLSLSETLLINTYKSIVRMEELDDTLEDRFVFHVIGFQWESPGENRQDLIQRQGVGMSKD